MTKHFIFHGYDEHGQAITSADPKRMAYTGKAPGKKSGTAWHTPPEWYALADSLGLPLIGPPVILKPDDVATLPDPCIVLTSNDTCSRRFSTLMEHASAFCMKLGRIKFLRDDGTVGPSPSTGQIFWLIDGSGEAQERFSEAFKPIGWVKLAPWGVYSPLDGSTVRLDGPPTRRSRRASNPAG